MLPNDFEINLSVSSMYSSHHDYHTNEFCEKHLTLFKVNLLMCVIVDSEIDSLFRSQAPKSV